MSANETNTVPDAAHLPAQSPYVGPRPFSTTERDRFFGREREIDELTALVISNPMVLFYAQSGAGKSSLINAGLLPEMEKESFESLPPVRVGLPASELPANVENIFVYNALSQWNSRPTVHAPAPDDPPMPVFAPDALAGMSLMDYLASRPRSTDEYEVPMPRVVIFDQFEEIFRAYPERWKEREPFFKQIRATLDADALLRVVFVMREDYIAELDPFAALLPDKLRVRFRLELLRRNNALASVTKPLQNTSVRFGTNVAEKLVDDLLAIRVGDSGEIVVGEFVEPVYLQVVCENLWNEVRRQGLTEITEGGLAEFGSVSRALSNFYENCLISVVSALRTSEDAIRSWFETQLITADKTRNRVRRSDKDDSTGGLANGAVERLEDLHILRADLQNDARWYELAHDRMIEPILRSNERARLTAAYVAVQQSQSSTATATSDTFGEMIQIIAPLFESIPDRPALLADIFSQVAPQILSMTMDYGDSAATFTANLIRRLTAFGRLSNGKPAAQALLEGVAERLPPDQAARLTVLHALLQESSPAALTQASSSAPPAAASAPPVTPSASVKSSKKDTKPTSDILRQLEAAPKGGAAPETVIAEQSEAPPADEAPLAPTAPQKAHLYIIYARSEREFVRKLAADLRQHGINIWNDTASVLTAWTQWDQTTADAVKASYAVLLVASPDARRAESVRRDIETARVNLKRIIPVWAAGETWIEAAPAGFGGINYMDARGNNYMNARSQLTALLLGVQTTGRTGASPADMPTRNPYKGLRAFSGDDTGDFFGRDSAINEMLDALKRYPQLLAVIGASGSGKSSVVMAGVLPRLRAGAVTGSRDWIYAPPFTPGEHPVQNLIASLSKSLPDVGEERIRRALTDKDPQAIGRLLRAAVYEGLKTRLVLIVDQFEEVFTQSNEDERQQLIDLLVAAAAETNASVTVILTLRADFFDRVLSHPILSTMISRHNYLLRPMTTAELRESVEKPAALAGLILETGLLEEILLDLGDEPGSLPLLQFTLDQLYERREGRRLTLAAYKSIGGVRGALAQHAETTYNLLRSDEYRRVAQTMFLRLVEVSANDEIARRRITRDELTLPDPDASAMMNQVVAEFVDAHLLFTDTLANTETVSISHEALIRAWERLHEWVDVRRDDLKLGSRIRADANEWNARNRPIDSLYRGEVLQQALAWLQRSEEAGTLQREFILASAAEEQRRVQSEQVAARRLRNLQRATLLAAVVGVVALILVVLSVNQTASAEQRSNSASTQIADAESAQSTALARLNIVDTQVAQRNAALTPVQQTLNAAVQQATDNAINAMNAATEIAGELAQINDVSAARRWVAAANGVLSLPDGNTETAALLAIRAANLASLPEVSAALNMAVERLYTLERYDDPFALPLELFPIPVSLPASVAANAGDIAAHIVDTRVNEVYTGHYDGSIRQWTANATTPSFTFRGAQNASVTALALSHDGRMLLSGAADGSVRLWDTQSGLLIRAFSGHSLAVTALAFAPDRIMFASGSFDMTVRVWEIATGEMVRTLSGHTAPINAVVFDATSRELYSRSDDRTNRRWTLMEIARPPVIDVAFACSRVFRELTDTELSIYGAPSDATCPVFGGDVMLIAPTATLTPSATLTASATGPPTPTATLIALPIQSIHVAYGEDNDDETGGERQIIVRFSEQLPGVVVYDVVLIEQSSGDVVIDERQTLIGGTLIITANVKANALYRLQLTALDINNQPIAYSEVVIDMDALTVAEPTLIPTPKASATPMLTQTSTMMPTPTPTPTAPQPPTSDTSGDIPDIVGRAMSELRLRTGPGVEYSTVATLTSGEVVTLLGVTQDGSWYNIVRADGQMGWITTRAVAVDGDLSGLPYVSQFTATPSPTPAPTARASQAGAAGVGAQRGVIEIGGGVFWTYNGVAGEALTVRVNSTEFDTIVSMLDQSGTETAFNDDTTGLGGATTTNSRIDVFLPANGVYRIEVRSFQNQSGGNYVLAVESDRTICGNSTCESNETQSSCPSDCGR
ncbi:MAG: TIR domain-containing protein [Chloroflexota bacterium]|nr:TIR domain-containing protein [Chloroflexota bacterium]